MQSVSVADADVVDVDVEAVLFFVGWTAGGVDLIFSRGGGKEGIKEQTHQTRDVARRTRCASKPMPTLTHEASTVLESHFDFESYRRHYLFLFHYNIK